MGNFPRLFKVFAVVWLLLSGVWYYQVQDAPKGLGDADAVVMFTGGGERLQEAFKLIKARRAPVLFLSGVHGDVKLNELLQYSGGGIWREQVILGRSAQTTAGNAREVASWVKGRRINSIILVTSNYHMPRARMELARMLSGQEIILYATTPDKMPSAKKLFWEYNKWFAVLFGARYVYTFVQELFA